MSDKFDFSGSSLNVSNNKVISWVEIRKSKKARARLQGHETRERQAAAAQIAKSRSCAAIYWTSDVVRGGIDSELRAVSRHRLNMALIFSDLADDTAGRTAAFTA